MGRKKFKNTSKCNQKRMISLIDDIEKILLEERREGNVGECKINGELIRIQPRGELLVLGDIHGDLESLKFFLKDSEILYSLKEGGKIIFLGDYGDRGKYSIEVYYTILLLKKKFPEHIIFLRGNHEFLGVSFWPHDLPILITQKYGEEGKEIYEKIRMIWNYFYLAAVVEGKYFLVHGGIPTNIKSIEEISLPYGQIKKDNLVEMLWNDPIERDGIYFNQNRGIGKMFGIDVSKKFLKMTKTKTIIRAHQPTEEGVAVNHVGLILTLSSTKVYGGKAAYLKIDLSEKYKDAYELKKIARIF